MIKRYDDGWLGEVVTVHLVMVVWIGRFSSRLNFTRVFEGSTSVLALAAHPARTETAKQRIAALMVRMAKPPDRVYSSPTPAT
jgi:hypothetical protein